MRGEFVYHDTLFVDVGGALKRHARASNSEIETLLDGKALKDQVAHRYEAQLIHYGLQRSKDKSTAKVRLQQALSQKRLTVPAHIVEMEAQMKKEYAASIRKARGVASQAAKGYAEDGAAAKGRKRKQSDTSPEPGAGTNKKTKITLKIGKIGVSIDYDSAGARSTGTSGKVTKSKTVSSSPEKASSLTKRNTPTTSVSTCKPSTTPPARKTTRDDVRTPSVAASKSSAKPIRPAILPPRIPVPQKTRIKAEPKVKKEPTTGHWSPVKTAPEIKTEVKPEINSTKSPSRRYITGVYSVTSPELSSQYPHEANKLRLFLCVDNEANKIWGGFELASKSGVLCITDYTTIDAPLSFGGRARDSHRRGLSFGRGCFGDIQFFDERSFTATVFNMFPEPVALRGERRPGPLWCGKSAWQFEREWNGFVTEAYGR